MKLSKYSYKGCDDTPFYPDASKHVQLPMYPNFKSTWETKKLTHMLIIEKSSSHLPLKTHTKIDVKQDQKLARDIEFIR